MGRLEIDRPQPAVSERRTHDREMGEARRLVVACVERLSRYEWRIFTSRARDADLAAQSFARFTLGGP